MTSITTRHLLTAGVLTAALTLAGALVLPIGPAGATSDLVGIRLGTTKEAIAASLTGLGYEVKKVKTEDGMLEAYATKDGGRYEVYVDTTTGEVAKVKDE